MSLRRSRDIFVDLQGRTARLLDLLAELRSRIYFFSAVDDVPIEARIDSKFEEEDENQDEDGDDSGDDDGCEDHDEGDDEDDDDEDVC